MNETFGSIKVYSLTTSNQPINSILQISNFSGQAQFTQHMACTVLTSDSLESHSGTMINITGTRVTSPNVSIIGNIRLSDVGTLIGPYVNFTRSANKGLYIYESRGSLKLQTTDGLIIVGNPVNAATTDVIKNISGWQKILEPTAAIPPTDLSNLITTVNTLLQTFADRGFLITTVPPQTPEITGVTVDISGFYVTWTPATVALSIDGLVYDSSGQSPYFIPIATTNTFYYSLTVDSSLPFLAAFCNINGDPTDLGNYYPIFGRTPSTLAYYRATMTGQINYILLSTETNNLSGNAVFFMKGSNASPTTPISFMYYSTNIYGSAYLAVPIILTEPGPQILTYNYALDSWTLN